MRTFSFLLITINSEKKVWKQKISFGTSSFFHLDPSNHLLTDTETVIGNLDNSTHAAQKVVIFFTDIVVKDTKKGLEGP